MRARRARRRLKLLRRHLATGSILEVGPGTSEVLALARECGFQVECVEHSPHLAAGLQELDGLRVHVGMFESVELPAQSFDAVLSFHVIEHVPDPRLHLRKAAHVVRPGGVVVIGTPNAESWEHRLTRSWSPSYSSAHVSLFTPAALRMLLESTGWQMLEMRTASYAEDWAMVGTALLRNFRANTGKARPRGAYAAGLSPKLGSSLMALAELINSPIRALGSAFGRGKEVLAAGRRI